MTTAGHVSTAPTIYPCDRGIPGNMSGRGYHHFDASPDGVVFCRYCGQKPAWAVTVPKGSLNLPPAEA